MRTQIGTRSKSIKSGQVVPGAWRRSAVLSIVQTVLDSPGQPLDAATRALAKRSFGHDFADVRVHADGRAARSARAVNAVAYTVGNHIVFAERRYAPTSIRGQRLLAHELTHVLQQRKSKSWLLQRAETDTSVGCAGLSDSASDVNACINAALARARAGAGGDADIVIDRLFAELATNKSVGRTAIEVWAERLGPAKVHMPAQSATKYRDVNFRLFAQPFFPILNPTMKVNGICIGSDKLGHFLQQGYECYEIAHREGRGEAEAEKYGVGTEARGFGLASTGVFSNADLEANRQGLRFYEGLSRDPNMAFDIGAFVNLNWNEEVNPSFYESSVGQTVWKNLLAGGWTGGFSDSRLLTSQMASVMLTMVDSVKLTGTYTYRDSSGLPVTGVLNGTVTSRRNSIGAVTGVTIDFEWREGTDGGTGRWTSRLESELQGSWGFGSSNSDRGLWHIRKSPGALPSAAP